MKLLKDICVKKRGIAEEDVQNFDIVFAQNYGIKKQPGDSKKAPYYKEHKFAEKIEKLIAKELGIDWDKHNSLGD